MTNYALNGTSYRIFNHETNTIELSTNVVFDEVKPNRDLVIDYNEGNDIVNIRPQAHDETNVWSLTKTRSLNSIMIIPKNSSLNHNWKKSSLDQELWWWLHIHNSYPTLNQRPFKSKKSKVGWWLCKRKTINLEETKFGHLLHHPKTTQLLVVKGFQVQIEWRWRNCKKTKQDMWLKVFSRRMNRFWWNFCSDCLTWINLYDVSNCMLS